MAQVGTLIFFRVQVNISYYVKLGIYTPIDSVGVFVIQNDMFAFIFGVVGYDMIIT